MDERTEHLRDVFTEVTGAEEATERRAADRGSLLDRADRREAVLDVVRRMRERYEFSTDLDDDALASVAAGVYDGLTDRAIAAELGVDAATVRRARTDLHLYRAEDLDVGFDPAALRERLAEDGPTGDDPDGDTDDAGEADPDGDPPDVEALAAALDGDPETVRRAALALRAMARSRQVNDRYRTEFDDVLADAGMTGRLTARAREHGLDEALADAEADVPF